MKPEIIDYLKRVDEMCDAYHWAFVTLSSYWSDKARRLRFLVKIETEKLLQKYGEKPVQ